MPGTDRLETTYERLENQRLEIERLRAAIKAAHNSLHDDNDAAGAETVLRVALQR